MNFFSLFQLPEKFELDQSALTKAYQTLVQLTHPDKFATASEQQRLLSVQKNAQVNDGFNVLKAPLSRAEHLLELRGIELQHEQQTMQDPAFLMQQMEWREELAEVEDRADPLDALDELDDEVQQHISHKLKGLADLLEQQTDDANHKAADEVRKLKFLYKLRLEIESKEDSLSDL